MHCGYANGLFNQETYQVYGGSQMNSFGKKKEKKGES
jgi:hypothetical protein